MTPEAAWKAIVEDLASAPLEPTEEDIAGSFTPSEVRAWMEREAWLYGQGETLNSLFAEVETGEDGRAKLAVIFNCVASGEPQPSPSVMLYHAARKLAAHDAYLEQDSRRLELESEEMDDAIWDDPVRADRRALAAETPRF